MTSVTLAPSTQTERIPTTRDNNISYAVSLMKQGLAYVGLFFKWLYHLCLSVVRYKNMPTYSDTSTSMKQLDPVVLSVCKTFLQLLSSSSAIDKEMAQKFSALYTEQLSEMSRAWSGISGLPTISSDKLSPLLYKLILSLDHSILSPIQQQSIGNLSLMLLVDSLYKSYRLYLDTTQYLKSAIDEADKTCLLYRNQQTKTPIAPMPAFFDHGTFCSKLKMVFNFTEHVARCRYIQSSLEELDKLMHELKNTMIMVCNTQCVDKHMPGSDYKQTIETVFKLYYRVSNYSLERACLQAIDSRYYIRGAIMHFHNENQATPQLAVGKHALHALHCAIMEISTETNTPVSDLKIPELHAHMRIMWTEELQNMREALLNLDDQQKYPALTNEVRLHFIHNGPSSRGWLPSIQQQFNSLPWSEDQLKENIQNMIRLGQN